jgi:serine protease Do
VVREGQEKEISVTIGKMPGDKELAAATPDQPEKAKPVPSRLGLSLEPAPDGRGVMVAGVEQDSPAATKGLKPGDVILQVGGVDVDDPAALSTVIEEAVKNGQKHVLCLIRSGDRQRFVAIPTSAS